MTIIKFKSLIFLAIAILSFSNAFATIPSGYYYYAKNKKQAALKTALHTYAAPMKEFEYGGGQGFTWEGFFYTDQKKDSSVVDMYSNSVRKFKGFSAVNGMHIEHSLPKSWWGGLNNNAYKDLFHLYPADAITNITKSNLPLGEVTGTPTLDNGVTKIGANGFETAYTENCFEPADEFKGDFARSYFYISTIYEDFAPLWQSPMMNNNTYPVWKPWALDLLLKWHHQDPVSPKELARIEAIYNLQGNRNPFIDYPDLADYIWGKDTANIFPFPDETEPFLLTPRRGLAIDFGVILVNDVRTQKLHIQGANIGTDISLKINNSSNALSLSTPIITAASAIDGIDLSISFSPIVSGAILDTLTIQGGGLAESLRIPLKALAAADFITLEPTEISPVGGTLNWISDPKATDYKLNVFQGDQQAGDLIIATYIEGSGWNKAIEIFNGTGKTVDLSSYSLLKQTDGAGDFGAKIQLSGALENNKSYVIANNNNTVNAGIVVKAQKLDSLISFNGNDAVALVRNGVTIDM
ncbi:MAG: endonuclease, partial [Paludibacter sp.]